MIWRHSTSNAHRTRPTVAIAVLALAAVALTACGGSKNKNAPAPSSTSANPAPTSTSAPAPTPSPTKKPVLPAAINPLTGIGAPPRGPIIAVKVDDTGNGRPPIGLDKADVVYIEQVEGGLTRMVAVFGTNRPNVEPVRSVRASDSELLIQYGRIAVVASGGGGQSLPTLDNSGLVGVINDRGGPGFFRDSNRPAPYNLGSSLDQVAANVKAQGSRDVGFKWAKSDPRVAASPRANAVNAVVGGTAVTYVWNPILHRYVRTIGGSQLIAASGQPIWTANVIVQFSDVIADYSDVDVVGNPSMHTKTVGRGRAVLFREGHRIEGRWARLAGVSGTSFTDSKGRTLLLAPGGVNVVLAATGSPLG